MFPYYSVLCVSALVLILSQVLCIPVCSILLLSVGLSRTIPANFIFHIHCECMHGVRPQPIWHRRFYSYSSRCCLVVAKQLLPIQHTHTHTEQFCLVHFNILLSLLNFEMIHTATQRAPKIILYYAYTPVSSIKSGEMKMLCYTQ